MITSILIPAVSKFPLGELVIAPKAANRIDTPTVNACLERHASGDWGEMPPGDIVQNERCLKHGGRLVSVFRGGEQPFWIITEADRSVTTILLPLEY